MTTSFRPWLVTLALAFTLGCGGEGTVTYRGTVTEAKQGGYGFRDQPNVANFPPIEGVRVSVCDGDGCRDVSDANGAWGPISLSFAPTVFGDERRVEVRFEADGFEPYSYVAQYGETADPSDGEKYLNVWLRRR
jgi:hypothetical protein